MLFLLTRDETVLRLVVTKLGRYQDIIEYRDTNLETISISDRFGFNRNIDI